MAGVEGRVDHRVEGARTERSLQVLPVASVPVETLYLRRNFRRGDSTIEDGNRVFSLSEKLDERQAEITRSADDEDLDRNSLSCDHRHYTAKDAMGAKANQHLNYQAHRRGRRGNAEPQPKPFNHSAAEPQPK